VNGWSQAVLILVTFAGSQGASSVISWLRNRKNDKARAAREQKAHEDAVEKGAREREQAERDRQKLLADAAAVAQTTAFNSTTDALVVVQKQCDKCTEELHGMRDVCGNLIDALEAIMAEDTPAARADARASIRLARRAM
jgi:hypothetical protein